MALIWLQYGISIVRDSNSRNDSDTASDSDSDSDIYYIPPSAENTAPDERGHGTW